MLRCSTHHPVLLLVKLTDVLPYAELERPPALPGRLSVAGAEGTGRTSMRWKQDCDSSLSSSDALRCFGVGLTASGWAARGSTDCGSRQENLSQPREVPSRATRQHSPFPAMVGEQQPAQPLFCVACIRVSFVVKDASWRYALSPGEELTVTRYFRSSCAAAAA